MPGARKPWKAVAMQLEGMVGAEKLYSIEQRTVTDYCPACLEKKGQTARDGSPVPTLPERA